MFKEIDLAVKEGRVLTAGLMIMTYNGIMLQWFSSIIQLITIDLTQYFLNKLISFPPPPLFLMILIYV